MSRRAWIIVEVAAVVVLIAVATAYLTGFIIVGDPFSGVWSTDTVVTLGADGERKTAEKLSGGAIIKRTSSGYVFTIGFSGAKDLGWHPLERHGRRLEAQYDNQRVTFEYRPWNRYLLWTWYDHGVLRTAGLKLEKVADADSVPSQTK